MLPQVQPTLAALQHLIYHQGVGFLRDDFYASYYSAISDPNPTWFESVDFDADVIEFWDLHPETLTHYLRTDRFQDRLNRTLGDAVASACLYVNQVFEKPENLWDSHIAAMLSQQLKAMSDEAEADPLLSRYPSIITAIRKVLQQVERYTLPKPIEAFPSIPSHQTSAAPSFTYRYPQASLTRGDNPKALEKSVLGNLWDALKASGFIASDTKVSDFYRIFSGQVVTNKVRWLGTNAQLQGFINAIEPKLLTGPSGKVSKKWEIAIQCFVNAEGESYTSKSLRIIGSNKKAAEHAEAFKDISDLLA